MGAIVAIMGEAGDPEIPERLERMLARSPYRGEPVRHLEGGLAIGVQTRGWDASLATVGNWTVAIHGVIGNWTELAPAHGWDFPDDASSAAKLAIAYEHLGDALFPKLRGEYAILIHDRREDRLTAVRDLWGQRPMFFERTPARTYIASEIRQIRSGSGTANEIDGEVLIQALLWRPTFPTRTHVKGLRRIQANQVARIKPGRDEEFVSEASIWTPPMSHIARRPDFEELTEELTFLIDQAVDRWLIGIPFTVSLSGGVDSATIWCSIAKKAGVGDRRAALGRPFSFRAPGRGFDESSQILRILEATGASEHRFVDPTHTNFITTLTDNAKRIDSPFYGAVSGFTETQRKIDARESELVLGGSGGDLVLAGSRSYLADLLRDGDVLHLVHDLWTLTPKPGQSRLGFIWSKTASPWLRRVRTATRPSRKRPEAPAWIHPSRREAFELHPPAPQQLIGAPTPYRHQRGLVNAISMYQGLCGNEGAEQLRSSDGLTLGSPLLDTDIVGFAFRAPPRAFSNGIGYKQLLRNVYYDRLGGEIRRWRNPYPTSALTVDEVGSLARLFPTDAWRLCDLEILDRTALEGFFGNSPTDIQAGCFLGELAIAEAVVRELC